MKWILSLTLPFVLFGLSILPAPGQADNTSGFLWTQNTKTPNGRSYLDGFVRGYIEGKKWGLEMVKGTLPHAHFDSSSPIDKSQLESRLFTETLYYDRVLEEENLKKTVDLVTQWYQDRQNWGISWNKLVNLAIAQVNGFHVNYITYQLRWLRDLSTQKRIDWFHTIDPATGRGQVKHYDRSGRITRVELVN